MTVGCGVVAPRRAVDVELRFVVARRQIGQVGGPPDTDWRRAPPTPPTARAARTPTTESARADRNASSLRIAIPAVRLKAVLYVRTASTTDNGDFVGTIFVISNPAPREQRPEFVGGALASAGQQQHLDVDELAEVGRAARRQSPTRAGSPSPLGPHRLRDVLQDHRARARRPSRG